MFSPMGPPHVPSGLRQAILLAGGADDALGVLVNVIALPLLERVLVLRLNVAVADLDGVQLISADTAVEDFLATGFGVKNPLVVPLDDGYRKGPIFLADHKERSVCVFRVNRNSRLLASLRRKRLGPLPVASGF